MLDPYPGAQGKGQRWLALCAAGISRHLLCGDRALPLPGAELAVRVGDITTEAAAVPAVGRGCHRGPPVPWSGGCSRPPPVPPQSCKAAGMGHPLVALTAQPGAQERRSATSDLWWSSAELQTGSSGPQRSHCPAWVGGGRSTPLPLPQTSLLVTAGPVLLQAGLLSPGCILLPFSRWQELEYYLRL